MWMKKDEVVNVTQDLGTLWVLCQGKPRGKWPGYPEESWYLRDHQPRSSFHRNQNFLMPRGLVKMSAQLNMVSTFSTLMAPDWIWSLKWCLLMERWWVQGPVRDTRSVAMARHAALSPQMVDWSWVVVMVELRVVRPGAWLGVRNNLVMLSRRWHSGIKALVHMESAMYLAFHVLRAILDWSLLTQWMGHPE